MRIVFPVRQPEARSAGTDRQYHHKSVDSCRMDSVFPGLEQIASALVTTTNLPLGYRGIPLFAQRQVVSVMGCNRTECGAVVVFDVSGWE